MLRISGEFCTASVAAEMILLARMDRVMLGCGGINLHAANGIGCGGTVARLAPVAHHFALNDIEAAYDLFANQRDGVLKVAITP
jgi:hypothetical protein